MGIFSNISPAAKLTKKGIQAFHSGDKLEAESNFRQAVKEDPKHEMAWIWLYSCVVSVSEKRNCLQKALAINPQREYTINELAKLPQPEHVRNAANWINTQSQKPSSFMNFLKVVGTVLEEIAENIPQSPGSSFQSIRANMQSMPSSMWRDFAHNLEHQWVSGWKGWVLEVTVRGNSCLVFVDMDRPGTSIIEVQDVTFAVSADVGCSLQIGQEITFSGQISNVQKVLGACQIDLLQVEVE